MKITKDLKNLKKVCSQPGLKMCAEPGIINKCGSSASCKEMFKHINEYRKGNKITNNCNYSNKQGYNMGNAPRNFAEKTCRRVVGEGGAIALAQAANSYEVEYQQNQQQAVQYQQQQAEALQNSIATNQTNVKTNPLLGATSGQDRSELRIKELSDKCSSSSSLTEWSDSDCDSVLENIPSTYARHPELVTHIASLKNQQQQAELEQQQLKQRKKLEQLEQQQQQQEEQRKQLERQEVQRNPRVSPKLTCDIDVCSNSKQNKRDIERLQMFQAQLTAIPEVQRGLMSQSAGKRLRHSNNCR